jgi:hypothetical protein
MNVRIHDDDLFQNFHNTHKRGWRNLNHQEVIDDMIGKVIQKAEEKNVWLVPLVEGFTEVSQRHNYTYL